MRIMNKQSWGYLIGSLLLAFWLCAAQIIGNKLLLLPCLVIFLSFVLWASTKNFAMPILLFFLPWSTLLKIQPGSLSFFTFALIGVCAVATIRNRFIFERYQVLLPLLILALTLISKIMDGSTITVSYCLFIFMLLLSPNLAKEANNKGFFMILTIFFSMGIISAALTAQEFVVYPNIARYIDVLSYKDITRLSGYYGDANFYSAHISAALSAVLLLLLQKNGNGTKLFLSVLSLFLLYCGFLSASKSFFIISGCILLTWIICVLKMPGSFWAKLLLLAGLILGLTFVFTSDLFSESLQIVRLRFSQSSSISSLTTGRSDTWVKYLSELNENVKLFLLGKGYTNMVLFDHATHNTVLQILFQFGILGATLIFSWITCFARQNLRELATERLPKMELLILIIGCFMPWMGIDIMFFDEFFLLQILVYSGVETLIDCQSSRMMSNE